ncbi:hypothetical protein [Paramagnetospirillum magnetotacticum]|uniref:hypothetical protein n=1 Tax=Paramagnetospirillum magnetotacticum TaxID=188 RepID=UPI0006968A57|nr:hypothetical protein [Paramagnetospirillum magnetotacticum]
MSDSSTAVISILKLSPINGSGDMLGLADVEMILDGVAIILHGVQLRANGKRTEVRLPRYRAPDGNWVAAISLPDEVKGPMGDVVIAAGLEAGLLRETSADIMADPRTACEFR